MRLYERGSYKLVLLTHLPKNEFGESPCASEVCFSQDFVNLGQIEVNCDATHGCFKPPNRCKDTVAQAACTYYKKRNLCTMAKRVHIRVDGKAVSLAEGCAKTCGLCSDFAAGTAPSPPAGTGMTTASCVQPKSLPACAQCRRRR